MHPLLLTICIPTYNRPQITLNLIANLPLHKEVEYFVIDDGSTKENYQFLKNSVKANKYPIQLYQKKNGGKLSAVRFALQYANGKYYMDLDSDDWLTKEYLYNILITIQAVEAMNIVGKNIIGIGGLCLNKDAHIVGDKFPKNDLIGGYLNMRADYKIKGDKEEVVLTEILKKLQIKFFETEKPNTCVQQWNLLGSKNWLFVNKIFVQKNIIKTKRVTTNWLKYIIENKNTSRNNFKIILDQKNSFNYFYYYLKSLIQYIRFSLHGAKPFFEKKIWQKHFILLVMLSPISFMTYLRDLWRLRCNYG